MFLNPPPKSKKEGFVYLMKSGDYHKIGLTRRDPRIRLKEITTPTDTIIVHVIETVDPEGLEHFLHEEFKEKRSNREWFKLDEDDVQWIIDLKW